MILPQEECIRYTDAVNGHCSQSQLESNPQNIETDPTKDLHSSGNGWGRDINIPNVKLVHAIDSMQEMKDPLRCIIESDKPEILSAIPLTGISFSWETILLLQNVSYGMQNSAMRLRKLLSSFLKNMI